MNQGRYEIVILKPTMVFFAFLASQLPQSQLPSIKIMQTDATAYVIPQFNSNKETIHYLEAFYPQLFRHEISRWLGEEARNPIENSAIDFLCCFKLEFHNHILVMEPSIENSGQLLTIKPRSVLLNWLKSAVVEEEGLTEVLEQVNLSHLVENATVLVKNFNSLKEINPFLQNHYQLLFESAMKRITGEEEQWPKVNSFSSFSQYFAIEVHTQLKHLI